MKGLLIIVVAVVWLLAAGVALGHWAFGLSWQEGFFLGAAFAVGGAYPLVMKFFRPD